MEISCPAKPLMDTAKYEYDCNRVNVVLSHRSRSLDSTDSTASLVSVLDHDSYVSYSSDEDVTTAQQVKACVEGKDATDPRHNEVVKDESSDKKTDQKVGDMEKDSSSAHNSEKASSPWEKWFVQKVKEERQQRNERIILERKEKLKKLEEEERKKIKMKEERNKVGEWTARKSEIEKLRKRLECQKLEMQRRAQEEKRKFVSIMAKENFNKWLKQKRTDEKKRKAAEKKRLENEEQKKKNRQAQAEEEYSKWCEKVKSQPKSAPNSFGYLSGKLTGYHDTSAYPTPFFYNSIPWHHPAVPRENIPKRVTSKKRVSRPASAC